MFQSVTRKNYFPLIPLLLSVIFTIFVWQVFESVIQDELQHNFNMQIEEVDDSILDRLQNYEQVLSGAQGLFAASNEVDRNEWSKYILAQNIDERFPGIQVIGYSQVVGSKENLAAHIEEIRSQGFPDFTVHPMDERDVYHSIIFVEPFDERNKQAFGLDMSFESNRNNSMEEARDSGQTSITKKITLVQEIDEDVQAGFLMMLPVYKNGLPHDTMEEKRENLQGYVYAAFRMNNLMDGILGTSNSEIAFRIFDEKASQENLMYDGFREVDFAEDSFIPDLSKSSLISFGNRDWMVEYSTLPTFFDETAVIIPNVILISGFLMSGILFYTFKSFSSTRMRLSLLTEITKKISGGDSQTSIDSKLKNSKYEISDLANGFDEMQKRIKEKAKSLEDMKRALDSSSIVAITDKHGTITYCNDKFCEISKYSRDELIGQNHRILKSGYHHDEFYRKIWQTISSGNVWQGSIKNKAKDGTFYWVRTTIVPFLDKSGRPEQYVAIRTDITKQKENEELIIKQVDQMKMVEKKKEEFTAMISHELKTPITPIMMWADILKDPGMIGELNNEQLEAVEKISSCADQLNLLVSDMFDAYKLDLERLSFNIENISVDDLMQSIAKNYQNLAERKGAKITNNTLEIISIKSDERRIYQILKNLVTNAVDFVPENSGEIQINASDAGDYVEFSVKDNGIGISKKNQDELFKKFYQTDTSITREHGGSGLGLTICKGIVEGLGGKIWVKSQVGKGSTFYFTIPKNFKKKTQELATH